MITLEIQKDPKAFEPGELIRGVVRWTDLDPGDTSVEVRLFWSTIGKGDRDFSSVDSTMISVTKPSGEGEFEFRAPASPYSFSGKLISLVWTIEARSNETLQTASRDITIAPHGREIRLYESSAP